MNILFWKALLGLLAFDLFKYSHNFAKIHHAVRSCPVAAKVAPPGIVAQVSQAVNYACAWYPKQALCLQRSVVTTRLLRSYGVSAQLVFGAQKLPFKAHAWVEVEGQTINERRNVQAIYGVWERC